MVYHIEIELPEGSDEFWEELARIGKRKAKIMLREEIVAALESANYWDAKVKVTRVIDT